MEGHGLGDEKVTLNQGWTTFATVNQIRSGYMVNFKVLIPDTLKVIVLNDDVIEVVTKYKKHGDAFVVNV